LLGRLSPLLYLTNGVTGMVPYSDQPIYLRSAPSAGGLYPTEIYLLSRGTPELPQGLYNYQVLSHSLVQIWAGAIMDEVAACCMTQIEADLALVLTGVFHRSEWRYEDRAYRRVLLDTGHVLGNLELAAALGDWNLRLIGGFLDQRLAQALFLEEQEEGPLCVAVLGNTTAPTALASPVAQDFPRVGKGHLLNYLHRVSVIEQPPEPSPPNHRADPYNFPFCLKVSTHTPPLHWTQGIAPTMVRRRSTRQYSGANLTLEELKLLLHFTYQPQEYAFDPAPDYFDLTLLSTFVAVLGVTGLEDGCYYYAPEAQELRQIRFKNFREEIHYLCLGQDLGRDAGAVVFHTAQLAPAVERYGERAYRYLHLDAGHLGQKLNLAAIRLGLGVSGIAGFFDDQVNEVLGIPVQEAVLYITTLGCPQA